MWILLAVIVALAGIGAAWFLKPSTEAARATATAGNAAAKANPSEAGVAAPATGAAGDDNATRSARTGASAGPARSATEKAAEQDRPASERKRKAADDQKHKTAETEAAPHAEPPRAKISSTREQVAQCQKENVFKREICMFKACNNKWGRDGCPAYEQNKQQNY